VKGQGLTVKLTVQTIIVGSRIVRGG
jgi:hypothetical protein